jgi:hypothetical protein
VVMVAVDTRERVLIASGVRDIENRAPGWGLIAASASCGARASRQVPSAIDGQSGFGARVRSPSLIAAIRINLLNSQADLPVREFHFGAKHATA